PPGSHAAHAAQRTDSTCPPAKATWTLTCSSATAHDLREDPVHRVGVDERDLEPEEAAPGLLVDQLGALGRELAECLADVGDLVGDVVHPGAALRQKLADVRLLAERGEQ